MKCTFKVAIVGVGKVGATAAYALVLNGVTSDLVLVAHDVAKADGERADLEHSLPFTDFTNITVTDDYSKIAGADVTIVTAGAAQKPGETRIDLLKNNLKIFAEIIPKVYAANPDGVVLVVTNPVDILTYHSYSLGNFRKGQVFGSGTLLDTARFRMNLADLFNVNARSIHAYVLGEHGDTSFPVTSSANIGGQLLSSLPEYSPEKVTGAYDAAKKAAYQIIQSKGATYYAIGTVISQIVKTISSDARTIMPVSIPLENYLGESDISLSVPCIVGRRGVERVLEVNLSATEQEHFHASAKALRDALASAKSGEAPASAAPAAPVQTPVSSPPTPPEPTAAPPIVPAPDNMNTTGG